MEVVTFWVLLLGSVWLLIGSIPSMSQIEWSGISHGVYAGIVFLAFFATLITFLIINYCTVKIGATKVAAYGFLTPVFVIVISVLIDMEDFDPVTAPGLLMIVTGMFLIQRQDTHITTQKKETETL